MANGPKGLNVSIGVEDKEAKRKLVNFEKIADKVTDGIEKGMRKMGEAGDKAFDKMRDSVLTFGRTAGKVSKQVINGTKKMRSGFEKVSQSTKEARENAQRFAGALTGAGGAIFAVTGLSKAFSEFSETVESARIFERLALGADFSVESLNKLNFVITKNGGDIDVLSDTIFDFSERLGEARRESGTFRDMFNSLGVDITKAKDIVFQDTLIALQNMRDETKRSSFGLELFSESWKILSTTISQGTLLKDLEEGAGFPTFSEKAIKALSQFDRTMRTIGVTFQKTFADFLAGGGLSVIEGTIKTFVNNVNKLIGGNQAESFGKRFADSIQKNVIPALETFTIGVSNVVFEIQKAGKIILNFFSKDVATGAINGVQLIENAVDILFIKMGKRIDELMPKWLKGNKQISQEYEQQIKDLEAQNKIILDNITQNQNVNSVLKSQESSLQGIKKFYSDINREISKSRSQVAQGIGQEKPAMGLVATPDLSMLDEFNLKMQSMRATAVGLGDSLLSAMVSIRAGMNEIAEDPQTFIDVIFGNQDRLNEQSEMIMSQTMAMGDQLYNLTSGIFDSISSLRTTEIQKEMSDLEKKHKAELGMLNVTGRRRAQITKKQNKEMEELQKQQREKERKSSIAKMWVDAFVNGASAFGQAVSQFGFPAGPIIGGVMQGLLLTNAAIATAQANAQSFATGGIVGGFQNASNGPDDTVANVRNGEAVMTANMQRELLAIARGEQQATGATTNITIERFSGNDEDMDRFENMMRDLQNNGRFQVEVVS